METLIEKLLAHFFNWINLKTIVLNLFDKFPEIIAIMSERKDGSMKLFRNSNLNLENRKNFFKNNEIKKVIAAEIVHSNKVKIVDEESSELILGVDGLVTRSEKLFLSVTVADCIPVYFYAPQEKIVALAHCGWRGIVDGIIENMFNKILQLGGKAENLQVALGPGINQCHFEIKADVLNQFENYSEFVIEAEGKIFIDLKGIIQEQLVSLGIKGKNIQDNKECTVENNEKYFSFRRDNPEKVEAMVAIIGMR